MTTMDRRRFIGGAAAGAAALAIAPHVAHAQAQPPLARRIPSSGVALPVIGLGTWITFNVGNDPAALAQRTDVMRAFFEMGGGMIDSSPMYGSAQATVGHGLREIGIPETLFAADKVWTSDADDGPSQIAETQALWGVPRFGLLQVHNLLGWEGHLETLEAMKAEGRIGHVGITTSHGRRHDEVEAIMRQRPIDFVQLTYNMADREAEARLLPLAAERGIAVIANRPFRQGALVDAVQSAPLPAVAAEIGAANWPQFLLKFIVSHPAVTVAIPATRRVEHLRENMGAAHGPMPDPALRAEMARAFESL
ncbi:aldo/keto reductase [Aurantimonas sp. HBX-1]|uniref:aldo/keto reductase n=1 Tax=Aurantimonas sp. HBX-1 TaxID=2906072 RepID=UPI001F47CDF6|nr:aldo/keto reductase [Aurantimonas sp. HBX-1]UIJ71383.1 aldo/keto reductase [Aurantimonas sp. HBX-1]